MTDKQQPEALRSLYEITHNITDLNTVLIGKGALNALNAENETLRTGYAAARLEIESLRARSVEPAGEYPALPTRYYRVGGGRKAWDEADMRAYVDADRAMRAAHPAGAQQPGAAYAALPECSAFLLCNGSDVTARAWNVDQMRAFADATHAMRASHGQAPAQAAPSARQAARGWQLVPTEVTDDMLAAFANCASPDLDWHGATESERQEVRDSFGPAYLAMLAAAPTTQPAPQREPTCKENLQVQVWVIPNGAGGGQFSWAPQDERYWTKLTAQAAPQQEAQEPVAWMATPVMPSGRGITTVFCSDRSMAEQWDHGGHREYGRMLVTPLYTAPQPSPASQGDAERLEQRSQPSESGGMTVAGSGASELGKLMREQRALRGGVYPDGNPNAARTKGGE